MTKWTSDQVEDFVRWHEERMRVLGYPEKIVAEFRRARVAFLARVSP